MGYVKWSQRRRDSFAILIDVRCEIVFDQNSALADIGRDISAEISAENVSLTKSYIGYLAKIGLFRPKQACFGQNLEVSAKIHLFRPKTTYFGQPLLLIQSVQRPTTSPFLVFVFHMHPLHF